MTATPANPRDEARFLYVPDAADGLSNDRPVLSSSKSEVVCSSRVPPPVLQLDREDEESEDGNQSDYLSEIGDECLQVS